MSYYFGHHNALTKMNGYRVLLFSFPNGYTARVSRSLEYPNSDSWQATLMHREKEVSDTAVSFNGTYLAKGKTPENLSSDEIEAYLKAVKALPLRAR